MKIQRFDMDEENYIHIKDLVHPLIFALYKNKPTFWGITDPVGKSGKDWNIIGLHDDSSVDMAMIPGYRATLIDEDNDVIWHMFEEPKKIIQSSGPINFKPPKGFPKK